MAINALFYENKIPYGTGVLEIVSEKPATDGENPGLFIPLRDSSLTGTFHGPLGSLTLSQTFRFSRFVIDKPIEAIYRFPLPGDAAVTEVVVIFGEEVIKTSLRERAAAEGEYDAAFEKGKKAVLVTRESPDVFTLHVTGIPPDTDVVVRTVFTILARVVPKGWEIRVPLTIGPRYVRADEKHPGTQANPLLSASDPGYRISVDICLLPAVKVIKVTPSAEIIQAPDATGLRIQNLKPNRDLLLNWTPVSTSEMLTAWSADDTANGYRYLMTLIHPEKQVSPTTVPREMILLVDQSGSMSGKKCEAAKASLLSLLDTLQKGEYFNICLFSDVAKWMISAAPVPAIPQTVQAAKVFIENTSLFSGTELGVALEQAIHQTRSSGSYSRHIIVITDGQVTDEARIFQLAEMERTSPQFRRISVISIDTAPNAYLAQELARIGGGVAKFLEVNDQVNEVLKDILVCWQPPMIHDALLSAGDPSFDVPGYRVKKSAGENVIDIGDLRSGMPVFLCGRVPTRNEVTHLTLSSVSEGTLANTIAVPGEENFAHALKVLFGSAKIQALEFLYQASYSPDVLRTRIAGLGYMLDDGPGTSLYPENREHAVQDLLKQLIISESLQYGIPSTLTGFIGVSERKGIVPDVTVAVPNATPESWDMGMIMQSDGTLKMKERLGDMDNEVILRQITDASCEEIISDEFHEVCLADLTMSSLKSGKNHQDLLQAKPLNVMSSKRSPARKKQTGQYEIPQLQIKNGEAILFDHYTAKKGKISINLRFASFVATKDVQLRLFLDGTEIETWDADSFTWNLDVLSFSFNLPADGILKGVLLDPNGEWDRHEIKVNIIWNIESVD